MQLAEWVKDTCLLFGTSAYMAFKIADMFTYGLEREVLLVNDKEGDNQHE